VEHRSFDLDDFAVQVGATSKERSALRQDLVRGLKDYYETVYGYDRYGAETIFMVGQCMGEPYVFGYGLLRILHDRRLSDLVKGHAAQWALSSADYGADRGIPYALVATIAWLARHNQLTLQDLRFGLVISAGESDPFTGVACTHVLGFFTHVLQRTDVPVEERAFWAHSLLSHHGDRAGAKELIDALLRDSSIPEHIRYELCRAWVNQRQPRLRVPALAASTSFREAFVAEHLPFWVAHASSWPGYKMIREGLVGLARLGDDPSVLAQTYIAYSGSYPEQIHGAVADIVAEHHESIPPNELRSIIERGISISGESPTRRRFYRLGSELLGREYLQRATTDTANSVRQWAARELEDPV